MTEDSASILIDQLTLRDPEFIQVEIIKLFSQLWLITLQKTKIDKIADKEVNKILMQAKDDGEKLVLEMNEKFHNSSEIKKNAAQQKINQMKENAIKDIKNTSIKIAIESVKKIISTSIDKSKLNNLFDKNLEETKAELKKINS